MDDAGRSSFIPEPSRTGGAQSTVASSRRSTPGTGDDELRPRPATRAWKSARAFIVLVTVTIVFWLVHEPVLRGFGGLLAANDPVGHADVLVVSQASGRAAAFEAARLYRAGTAPRIVLPSWTVDPLDERVRSLGIPFLSIPDLAHAILVKSGVPERSIVQLPDRVDGSDTEVAAVTRYLREAHVASVVYIAPATHVARVRWMLHHQLPTSVRVMVRSPDDDGFAVDGWWRSRDQAREVMSEALRWANTALLGDAWREPDR